MNYRNKEMEIMKGNEFAGKLSYYMRLIACTDRELLEKVADRMLNEARIDCECV